MAEVGSRRGVLYIPEAAGVTAEQVEAALEVAWAPQIVIGSPPPTNRKVSDVVGIVNHAANDVQEWLDWRFDDEEHSDLLNLLVNAIVHRLTIDEDAEMTDIVRAAYSEQLADDSPDNPDGLPADLVVLRWFE